MRKVSGYSLLGPSQKVVLRERAWRALEIAENPQELHDTDLDGTIFCNNGIMENVGLEPRFREMLNEAVLCVQEEVSHPVALGRIWKSYTG